MSTKLSLATGKLVKIRDGIYTLPETNIATKNGWSEYYFSTGEAYFQVLC